MRKFIIALALLLVGGVIGSAIGYQFGAFGPALKDGMHQTYGVQIDRDDIRGVLNAQAEAWNRGDIDGFMSDYWRSADLRFASGGSVNMGWDATITRYKARYPDKAAMGSLAFTDLDIQLISEHDALVFGRWTLTRDNDAPTGLFTLHMKNIDGAWKIVSDHTSSAN